MRSAERELRRLLDRGDPDEMVLITNHEPPTARLRRPRAYHRDAGDDELRPLHGCPATPRKGEWVLRPRHEVLDLTPRCFPCLQCFPEIGRDILLMDELRN